jgi:hypothetical protein
MSVLFASAFIALVVAIPSIKVDSSGHVVIDSDGGQVQVTSKGSNVRDLLAAPRQFGARFVLGSNTVPSVGTSYGFGGARIDGILRNNAVAATGVINPPTASSPYACGLSISFSDNGAPFAQVPTCTLQSVASGQRQSPSSRAFDTTIVSQSGTSVDVLISGKTFNSAISAIQQECETGDGLIISCFA